MVTRSSQHRGSRERGGATHHGASLAPTGQTTKQRYERRPDPDPRRLDFIFNDDGRITTVPGRGRAHWRGNDYEIFDPVAYCEHSKDEPPQRGNGNAVAHYSPLANLERFVTPFRITPISEQEAIDVVRRGLSEERLGWFAALRYIKHASWKEMDYSTMSQVSGRLIVWQGVLYDYFDFGNLLWGAGACALRMGKYVARLAAHYNSLNKHGEFDTRHDQRAIGRGYRWARRRRIHREIWPPDGQGVNTYAPKSPVPAKKQPPQ